MVEKKTLPNNCAEAKEILAEICQIVGATEYTVVDKVDAYMQRLRKAEKRLSQQNRIIGGIKNLLQDRCPNSPHTSGMSYDPVRDIIFCTECGHTQYEEMGG